MDIQAFLRLLLPDEGVKFLTELIATPKGKTFIHYSFTDIDVMAEKALALSNKNKNIFFACATYEKVIIKTTPKGKSYESGRTQDNAVGARALWLDIDVGKASEANSYSTQKVASEDIKAFCEATGLHRPMVVSSGNGFHCYWLFDSFVAKNEWNLIANAFREVTTKFGLKADPSCDKDISRVLRPPQTINPKGNKEVIVLRQTDPKPATYYKTLFSEYLGIPLATVISAPKLGNQLLVQPVYPPSSLKRVAEHCQTIKFFKDTGASDFEPTWRACLGVAKHTYDGEELAHAWSSQDARYDYTETQAKMDSYGAGPTTCEMFRATAESCKGCTLSVKSPIQLGYSETFEVIQTTADTTEESSENAIASITTIGNDPNWPSNVQVLNNRMSMSSRNAEGYMEWNEFGYPKFWPVDRVKLEDATYGMLMRMEVKPGKFRDFDVPTKNIVDGRSLKQALAAHEVIITNEKLAMSYMQSYSDRLRQHMEEINTYQQFGWTKDFSGILLGNKLISGSEIREVRIGESLKVIDNVTDMYTVSGTKQEWIDGVNLLYNTLPNSEPYQYTIATQFGGWLCALMEAEEWNGIPLSLTSSDTGFSKSTATKIGLNAVYKSNITTISDSTIKAVPVRASSMGTVPFLIDEVTRFIGTSADMSDTAYAMSNGRCRIGAKSDGKERAQLPPFKVMTTMTSNQSTMFQLSESKVNPEAAQMRIFEIALEDYPKLHSLTKECDPELKAVHQEMAAKLCDSVYGVLGEEYLQYVINNRPKIKVELDATYIKLLKIIGVEGGNATKERFYIRHVTNALVALSIMLKLKYVSFDKLVLTKWAVRHVNKLRAKNVAMSSTAEETLATMMAHFTGRILVTKGYEKLDGRAGVTEEPMLPIYNDVVARLALGTKTERGRVILAVRAVDEWCLKNGKNALEFRRQLLGEGFIKGNGVAKGMYLAKGVPTKPLGIQRCVELDFSKMQGYLSEINNVTEIKPTQPETKQPEGAVA